MKTPITYYGGKQNMVKHILPLIPEHNLYCEPFFGGGAIFFAKPPSPVEVINDVNNEVVNFYRISQTQFENLKYEVDTTLHSRQLHTDAQVIYHYPHLFSDVKRAWAFWTLANQSFSANITGGWGYERKTNKTSLKVENKKLQFTYEFKERLKTVQIENTDALKVIKSRDSKDSFHYCDPPYYNSDCGHYNGYKESDFVELLETLSNVEGKFLLSSYPSDPLKKFVKENKWHQITVSQKVSVTYQTTKTKTEVLTANYDINALNRR